MDIQDEDKRPVRDLLRIYADVIAALRAKDNLRTWNNPVADYSEYLFCNAMNWKPEPASNKGFDAICPTTGLKYQIKGRRLPETERNQSSRQLGIIRNLSERPFDFLAGVLFKNNFEVKRAAVIPYEVVMNNKRDSHHQNGAIFYLTNEIWEIDGVCDVTERLVHFAKKNSGD